MLVFLNSAPKGGSTWLVQIVKNSQKKFDQIPLNYQDNKWRNSSIDKNLLGRFLFDIDYSNNDFYCKQHWTDESRFKLLLKDNDIKMVNIVRDIRDVLVSRYFHDRRLGNISNDITIKKYYYENGGREIMLQYIQYHKFWHDSNEKWQPFLCSYYRLHSEFNKQVSELFSYLGFGNIDQEEIDRLQKVTSFSQKSKTGEGEFFRKGIVGDWKNHLTDDVVKDLSKMMEDTGYKRLLKQMSIRFGWNNLPL